MRLIAANLALVRFGVVGLSTTATHVLVATSLINHAGLHPTLANVMAFLVATGLGYVLNTFWSFQARPSRTMAGRYLTVTAVGAVCCAALSALAQARGVNPLLAIAATVLVVPLISFDLHQRWTYRIAPPTGALQRFARSRPGASAAVRVPRPAVSSLTSLWRSPQPCCSTPGGDSNVGEASRLHTAGGSPMKPGGSLALPDLLPIAIICALVLVLHGGALQGHWRWDDGPNLLRATQYSLTDLFTQPEVLRHASGNQLAPFNLAIYIVNLRLFGPEPMWFYAQHLATLAAACVAFWLLLRLWLHPMAALAGSVLLLTGLPTTQMAQQLMVGHYILGLFWVCLMLWSFARALSARHAWWFSLLAAVAYALASLCKEVYVPAVLLLPWLPALGARPSLQRRLCLAAPAFAVALAYAGLRWYVFQGVGGYHSGAASIQTMFHGLGIVSALLGSGWPGAMAMVLLAACVVALLWKPPAGRLALVVALLVAVAAPLAFVAASAVDWGQHARYLFLPWLLVCVAWGVWLSPSPDTSARTTALRVAALIAFVLAAGPAAHMRWAQDRETHAMFDAHTRQAVGPDAGRPVVPAAINAPGYLTAVVSAANAAHRALTPATGAAPDTLNPVYPSSMADVPSHALTWQPDCACMVSWQQASPVLRALRLEQQRTGLLLALPQQAPWPPMADGVDGQIQSVVARGDTVELTGWLPTHPAGTVVFVFGWRQQPQNMELQVHQGPLVDQSEFTLRAAGVSPEQHHPLCVVVQSQRAGEGHRFQLLRGIDATEHSRCSGLLHPAARRGHLALAAATVVRRIHKR